MSTDGACYSSSWTREQDQAFEDALATISKDEHDRWQKIAAMVPEKTVEEIRSHYKVLVEDIDAIDSGCVPLPCYSNSLNDTSSHSKDFDSAGGQFSKTQSDSVSKGKSSGSDHERRKGIAWTEEEHRLFLEGLAKYGKGDWRSIARHFVVTRTPTQVASHAQKYFIRQNSSTKEKRRPSIHDITDKSSKMDASSLHSTRPVKVCARKAAGGRSSSSKRSGPPPALYPEPDMSDFVPPTIVQSSTDIITKFVAPVNVASSQVDSVYATEALSPGSLFAGLPELTRLH